MFGSTQQKPAENKFGTLFGSSTAPPGGLFGSGQVSQAQPAPSLFGSSNAQGPYGASQQNQGSSLFQQPPQQSQMQQSQIFGGRMMPAPVLPASLQQSQQPQLPQLGKSSVASFANSVGPRDKSIPEQMRILYEKWNPSSANCVFQTYFYNQVQLENAPFYGPGSEDDEKKWEEALSNKPGPGAIPVLVKGFESISNRISQQQLAVNALQNRLHEINDSLTNMKQQHELAIESRVAEARRKHVVYTQRCLALATKVQILRNRGYAMDTTEEELKKKLVELEKKTFDPVLGGRQEEIWARMSGIRERTRILEQESKRLGKDIENQNGEALSEEDQKTVKKLLDSYDSQLTHLHKELEQTDKDWKEWETASRPVLNGTASGI